MTFRNFVLRSFFFFFFTTILFVAGTVGMGIDRKIIFSRCYHDRSRRFWLRSHNVRGLRLYGFSPTCLRSFIWPFFVLFFFLFIKIELFSYFLVPTNYFILSKTGVSFVRHNISHLSLFSLRSTILVANNYASRVRILSHIIIVGDTYVCKVRQF